MEGQDCPLAEEQDQAAKREAEEEKDRSCLHALIVHERAGRRRRKDGDGPADPEPDRLGGLQGHHRPVEAAEAS